MSLPAPKLKSLRNRPFPSMHGKKLSPKLARLVESNKLMKSSHSSRKLDWFRERLHAKQNLRTFYGWLPAKYLQKTMKKAYQSSHPTGPIFLQHLERLAFMVVYRAGFACTPREAQSQIKAGWYTLNGSVLKAPKKSLEVGDILVVVPEKRALLKASLLKMKGKKSKQWVGNSPQENQNIQDNKDNQESLHSQSSEFVSFKESTKVHPSLKLALLESSSEWSQPSLLLWRLRLLGDKYLKSKHMEAVVSGLSLQKACVQISNAWKDVVDQDSFPDVPKSMEDVLNQKYETFPLPGVYSASHLEVNPKIFSCVLIHPPLHLVYPVKVDERGLEALYR